MVIVTHIYVFYINVIMSSVQDVITVICSKSMHLLLLFCYDLINNLYHIYIYIYTCWSIRGWPVGQLDAAKQSKVICLFQLVKFYPNT